jgi:hypothetical protein
MLVTKEAGPQPHQILCGCGTHSIGHRNYQTFFRHAHHFSHMRINCYASRILQVVANKRGNAKAIMSPMPLAIQCRDGRRFVG